MTQVDTDRLSMSEPAAGSIWVLPAAMVIGWSVI